VYPLTSKQSAAWALFQKGASMIQIAKQMKASRQYVQQTLKIAEGKISKSLLDAARSNDLEIRAIRPDRGVLLGHNRVLGRNVVVTYTSKYGIKVWFWYDKPEEVRDEKLLDEAREYLFNQAEERGIKLSHEEKNMHPSRLARTVFSRILPEAIQ